MSSFSPHPPRGAGPEPGGAVSSSPAAAAHSAHTPGLGTERQGLLRLLRSGSARGHRDARGRRGPSGPAAQRGPRGRPGAAAAAAAAGASAKRYSRGTGWGLVTSFVGPGQGSSLVPGGCWPGTAFSLCHGERALGREGRSLEQVPFPLPELGRGVCRPPPQRTGRAFHCSSVSESTCQH